MQIMNDEKQALCILLRANIQCMPSISTGLDSSSLPLLLRCVVS